MAPLLAAFARGTRRSRLRQLVVVCPAGHALVEVFPTGVGPVAVWRRRDAWQLVAGEATYLDHQLTWLAAPLTETVDGADGEDGAGEARPAPADDEAAFVTRRTWSSPAQASAAATTSYLDDIAACRCTGQAVVDGRQLLEWLTAGTRRAVADI